MTEAAMREDPEQAPALRGPHPLAVATAPRFRAALEGAGLDAAGSDRAGLDRAALDPAQREAAAALSAPLRHGAYLWGEVGRGKTMLADRYFEAVPTTQKRRFHFHGFFRDLQAELIARRQPLEQAVDGLLGPARAVLFDEFHVHDIADAVYLTETLRTLLERGVLLLATSNYPPHGLMPDRLNHVRFLPAIELIEAHLEIIELGAGPDHRRTSPSRRPVEGFAAGSWRMRERAPVDSEGRIELTAADIPIRAVASDEQRVVLHFADVCERPVGTLQYLWIAERYGAVELTGVPPLDRVGRQALLRLGNLVDVLVDRDVRLDVEAAGPPEALMTSRARPRDAERTLSRLSLLNRQRYS